MPSTSNSPKGDNNVGTYVVQDSKKKEELQRVSLQSHMITSAMGGVLAEQADGNVFQRVLDVACGTGEWIREAAQTYPDMSLVGIDINAGMIEYARIQAQEQGLADRVAFQVMDVLKKFDFPDNSFDLVNLRFGVSFVRTWEWPSLLLEMQRVVRPGGIVRLTEAEIELQGTSKALTTLYALGTIPLYRAGHLFEQDKAGLTDHLAELLTNSWCEDVQRKFYPLIFRGGTAEGELFKDDIRYLYLTMTPFVKKWGGLTEDYEALYQQAFKDMEQPDFTAIWPHLTVWGRKSVANQSTSTQANVSSRREKKRMSTASSSKSPSENTASTYMVQNSKKKEEVQRLVLQSRMITEATGGVLPEQPHTTIFRDVLDIACGTGDWAIEAARTYPELRLVGVDINPLMIDYASAQARAQGVADRVAFQVMDALKGLNFPDNAFDLVDLRFGISFVRTWEWPPLLLEMQRVVRPGGIIRWGESDVIAENTSPALMQMYDIALGAFYRAGHIFTQSSNGLTSHMAELLTNSWCENVQTKTYPIRFRAGTPECEKYIDDVHYLYVTTTPFVQKWVGLPENYDALHQQSLKEMRQPDFSATWPHVTAWGSKPLAKSHTSIHSSSRREKESTSTASASKPVSNDATSTYMVQDSKKKAEIQRQVVQGRLLTNAMGGVLAEQPDPYVFRHILDVACGPGSWALDTVITYPETNAIGVDINPLMTEYAKAQAQEQGLTDRAEFQVMDALKKLDFPDNTFDLVNLRFAVSFVRTWDWPSLLLEMQRVVRPGGIIRLTEGEISNPSTSSAFTELSNLFVRALYQAGHLFTSESGGLTHHLAELLMKSWCDNVQVKAYPVIFRAGTPEGENFIEDTKLIYQTIRPFLQKSVGLPENYDALYREVSEDMEQANFFATWPLVTVWGSKPLTNKN